MKNQIPGLPTVFQSIASPECDPFPRPFEGDPYEAAQPLLARLKEILSTWPGDGYGRKSAKMREDLLGLAWRVPEWHNHVFDTVVSEAQKIFDGLAPPVVKIKGKYENGFPLYVAGIGIRDWTRTDLTQCAVELIAPIVSAVKEREGQEIVARDFHEMFPLMLNYPCKTVYFGELPITFRATEEAGFMHNQFRILVGVSTDILPDNGQFVIDYKRMKENWDR